MAVGVGDLLVLSKLVTSRAPLRSLETRSTGETRSTREERVVLSLLSLETRLERVIRLERRETFIIIVSLLLTLFLSILLLPSQRPRKLLQFSSYDPRV
jgi:hypothetical protein